MQKGLIFGKMEKWWKTDPIALEIYYHLENTQIKLSVKIYIFLDFIRFSVNFLIQNLQKLHFHLFRTFLLLDKLLPNTVKTILNKKLFNTKKNISNKVFYSCVQFIYVIVKQNYQEFQKYPLTDSNKRLNKL
jgi:hypothetical protein